MRRSHLNLLSVLVAAIFLVCVGSVLAAKVENVFGGKVLVLKKNPPSYFSSSNGFVSFLRSNSIKTVYENEDHTWAFQTMAFFKKALGDYEVEMVFYDVTDGQSKTQRRFVDSFTQYTQDRNTRILNGKSMLTRPSFDADINYMIVVQHGSEELATGTFSTKGVTQSQLDDQARLEHEMKKMEESMKDLEQKAKEQQEAEKKEAEKKSKKAADDLF